MPAPTLKAISLFQLIKSYKLGPDDQDWLANKLRIEASTARHSDQMKSIIDLSGKREDVLRVQKHEEVFHHSDTLAPGTWGRRMEAHKTKTKYLVDSSFQKECFWDFGIDDEEDAAYAELDVELEWHWACDMSNRFELVHLRMGIKYLNESQVFIVSKEDGEFANNSDTPFTRPGGRMELLISELKDAFGVKHLKNLLKTEEKDLVMRRWNRVAAEVECYDGEELGYDAVPKTTENMDLFVLLQIFLGKDRIKMMGNSWGLGLECRPRYHAFHFLLADWDFAQSWIKEQGVSMVFESRGPDFEEE